MRAIRLIYRIQLWDQLRDGLWEWERTHGTPVEWPERLHSWGHLWASIKEDLR